MYFAIINKKLIVFTIIDFLNQEKTNLAGYRIWQCVVGEYKKNIIQIIEIDTSVVAIVYVLVKN